MESKVKLPSGPAGQDGVNGSDGAAGVDGTMDKTVLMAKMEPMVLMD